MTPICINDQSKLEKARVKLSGEIRGYPYTIEMDGWKCPNCDYQTIDGKQMSEFGRLAADEYRRAVGLLTSDEIVELRHSFGESQEEFAKRIGVGPASIKRWELGKIQDKRSDEILREKAKWPVLATVQYVQMGSGSTVNLNVSSGSYTVIGYGNVAPAWSNIPNQCGTSICNTFAGNAEASTQYEMFYQRANEPRYGFWFPLTSDHEERHSTFSSRGSIGFNGR